MRPHRASSHAQLVRASFFAAIPALLALSGCVSDGGFSGRVQVADDYFEPDGLTVQEGTDLTFFVEASAERPHTITIHKAADAHDVFVVDENVSAGHEVQYKFDSPGTYHVFCKLHAKTMTTGMSMVISVE